jgi:hypothetical protein
VRREREKALERGNTRRAAKLGAREERVEHKLARRDMLALGILDPEVEVGELAAAAIASRHIATRGGSSGRAAGVSAGVQTGEAQPQFARPRSRVMDDAHAVSARRKRQLGWETEE